MKPAPVFKCVSQTAHTVIERTSCSLISQIELICHDSFLHVLKICVLMKLLVCFRALDTKWQH